MLNKGEIQQNLLVQGFIPIKLGEMDSVMFMNRVDRKYCINVNQLQVLLEKIQDSYYCLEIDSRRVFRYNNTYYDNWDDAMYNNHLRGKLNRYKIRVRQYNDTDMTFLEVKFKNNKGKTYKSRIRCDDFDGFYREESYSFLEENTPYKPEQLRPVMHNTFQRITLVNKDFNERCTIDTGLIFEAGAQKEGYDGIAIVEVKSEGHTKSTPILRTIRDMNNTCPGFSKYCFGRSVLDETLKNNRYRSKIRWVGKVVCSA